MCIKRQINADCAGFADCAGPCPSSSDPDHLNASQSFVRLNFDRRLIALPEWSDHLAAHIAAGCHCWERNFDWEQTCCRAEMCAVSYTHLRAHETRHDLVCRLLLEKKK